jgi:hypothetical protein
LVDVPVFCPALLELGEEEVNAESRHVNTSLEKAIVRPRTTKTVATPCRPG